MAKLNLQVIKSGGQFMPSTEYDAKKIEEYKEGQVFNLQPTGKRSNPHHNLYWATLKNVCDSTNRWPTEQLPTQRTEVGRVVTLNSDGTV